MARGTWLSAVPAEIGRVHRSSAADRIAGAEHWAAAWSKLVKRANLNDFRFHDLRHHFASRLVQSGIDLNTVRDLLGHADLEMVLRYAHLSPDRLTMAVEKVAR